MANEMRTRCRECEAVETIDRENHPLDAGVIVSDSQILLEGVIGTDTGWPHLYADWVDQHWQDRHLPHRR